MPPGLQAGEAPKKINAEFSVSSSLPPMVTGALAGEVEVSVTYLYLKAGVLRPARYLRGQSQGGSLFAVRMQWWGDRGPGTVLTPALLEVRDEKGDSARRAALSDANCALFPVRCGLDGLVAYLNDMGHIGLDVLVHDGDPMGARHVGRCLVPVGNWDGQLRARPDGQESTVVAEGYFPVVSLNGSKHAGDLRVRVRACLGPSSRLRRVLEAAKIFDDDISIRGETLKLVEALGEADVATHSDQTGRAVNQVGESARHFGQLQGGGRVGGLPASRGVGSLPPWGSFDSDDLSNASSFAPPANRLPPGSATLSSFQLNEALAKFDASDALPVWPTPKGSLYRPSEAHGEAPPTPRHSDELGSGRGRLAASTRLRAVRKALSGSNPGGRDTRSRMNRRDVDVFKKEEAPSRGREFMSDTKPEVEMTSSLVPPSISPERQAPHANPEPPSFHRDKARAEAAESNSVSPHADVTAANTAAGGRKTDETYLVQLLDRGKKLREKMAHVTGNYHPAVANVPTNTANKGASPLPDVGIDKFTTVPQPGLVSGALLGSSLKDDIEGVFDTLSDASTEEEGTGMTVRDPGTRRNEDRVINILLAAAGPPPSSLAFPALAEVERRRADSLARVRFLRIRLSRLVMFGSMTSAPEGHGWQLRFRLPAFAMPPARGRNTAGSSVTKARGATEGEVPGVRVISLPIPARVPTASHQGKVLGRAAGRTKPQGANRTAGSMLRVRRGCGAADLVVGETSLLEEVVCAVNVDDACVRRWIDAAMEFLLVDGRKDGVAPPRPEQNSKQHLLQQHGQRQAGFRSTVEPGDRVAAVATLPLRDLVLSAELGVAMTLDLTEVVDFWAAEDARTAASGRRGRGRGGRILRNPYRANSATAARPLVLGDRAIGALAVALELVPGEADISPEHSRPERERVEKLSDRRKGEGNKFSKRDGLEQQGGRTASDEDGRDDIMPERSDASVLGSAASPACGERKEESPSFVETSRKPAISLSREEMALNEKTREEAMQDGVNTAHRSSEKAIQVEALAAGSRSSVQDEKRDEETRRLPTGRTEALEKPVGLAVMLRIDGLTLAPQARPGIKSVRVAYSFTQGKGHSSANVTHRSIQGFRSLLPPATEGKLGAEFTVHHKEIIPTPSDSDSGRCFGANANRVFEVWGSTFSEEENESNVEPRTGRGREETLLGLAKVSLGPFSAHLNRDCSAGSGIDEPEAAPLATAADGHVPIIDPFSGRAVGELNVFVALGLSSTLAGLSADGDHGSVDGTAAAVADHRGIAERVSAARFVQGVAQMTSALGCAGSVDEHGATKEESNDDDNSDEGSGAGGVNGRAALQLLDDSVSELSTLLNPGRAQGPTTALSAGRSGGFNGLVRHVVELCAVGELPLELNASAPGQQSEGDQDAPVGCTIEYSLPGVGHARLDFGDGGETNSHSSSIIPTAGETHELWWDADSGILNSRARHSIKMPSGLLDAFPKNPDGDEISERARREDVSLGRLLDCMFGEGDVRLSLFWSAGGCGAERNQQQSPREASVGQVRREQSDEDSGNRRQERRCMGTAVLRRDDLLPLVRRSSARTVLTIQIDPHPGSHADGGSAVAGGDSTSFPPPRVLPLSVSYRREPTAVARRKSRGWSCRREANVRQEEESLGSFGTGERDRECQEKDLDMPGGGGCDVRSQNGPPIDEVGLASDSGSVDVKERGRYGLGGRVEDDGGDTSKENPQGLEKARATTGEGKAAYCEHFSGTGSPDSRSDVDNSSATSGSSGAFVHRSSRTEHILPAHTTVCIRVDSIYFLRPLLPHDIRDMAAYDGDGTCLAYWASFAFPKLESWGRGEQQTSSGVSWGNGRDENGMDREEYWSPAVPSTRQDGSDGVPLAWRVELPVTIDAAFVRFVHTQSLEIRIWSGVQGAWPRGGAPAGVASVPLRSLLTTLGGVGGTVSIVPHADDGCQTGGKIAVRLFFKHRSLGCSEVESDGAAASQPQRIKRGGEGGGIRVIADAEEGERFAGDQGRSSTFTPQGCSDARDGRATGGGSGDSGERSDPKSSNSSLPPSLPTALSSVPAAPEFATRNGVVECVESDCLVLRDTEPDAALQPQSIPDGGRLRVFVERAMRLPPEPARVEEAGSISSPAESLPSTYVTFRWEEGGKPPLRSPFAVGVTEGTSGGGAAGGGGTGALPGVLNQDGEAFTCTVENTSNPVFEHTTELRLAPREAWRRVCGPSAAFVFRVWRRPRRRWWDATKRSASPTSSEAPPEGTVGPAAISSARIGDKLIGSAVVALEVLRGAAGGGREGLGLPEIDGWYHVLDDLQRPQGQLKVCVRPQHPVSNTEKARHAKKSSEARPSVQYDTGIGDEDVFGPALQITPPATRDEYGGNTSTRLGTVIGGPMSTEEVKDRPETPPLHDPQTHLRAVHALLESLPPEYRSAQRQRPASGPRSFVSNPMAGFSPGKMARPFPDEGATSSRATPMDWLLCSEPTASRLFSAQEELRTALGSASDPGSGRDTQSPTLPEIQRLLLNLDEVDRQLFALGPSSNGSDETGDARGCGRVGGEGSDKDVDDGCGFPPRQRSSKQNNFGEKIEIDVPAVLVGDNVRVLAAATIQRRWRIVSLKRRRTAAALAKRKAVEAAAQRQRIRIESAEVIQAVYRRAQARHRARAEVEERRRWVTLQQRRTSACLTIERAWKAFECRHRGQRELAEARARAAATAVESQRRADQSARAAVVIQKLLRGGLSRRIAQQLRVSRDESGAANEVLINGSGSSTASAAQAKSDAESTPSPRASVERAVAVLESAHRQHSAAACTVHVSHPGPKSGGGASSLAPRPVPSTFYNQLSQDPRRRHPLPEAHVAFASASSFDTAQRIGIRKRGESRKEAEGNSEDSTGSGQGGDVDRSGRFGSPPPATAAGRASGAVRPPRFADLETARIARIMKGNLQHWAGVRSFGGEGYYSSSDDFDL